MTSSPSREGDEAWRKSLVGKEIEIEYAQEFFLARIQSYHTGLFTALYFSDGSVEKLKLYSDFTATDPKGEDKMVWRFTTFAGVKPSAVCFPPTAEQQQTKRTKTMQYQQHEEEEDIVKWREALVGTDVELKIDGEWTDCHVDKVEEPNGMFTLYVVDEERRERYKLEQDGKFTSDSEAAAAILSGEWRRRPKRLISAEDRLWRESIVNRVISLPYGDEWLEANVEEDLKNNDLFLIRYLDAPSFEQVMLFQNMKGSDPSGDEEFEWKLVDNRVANAPDRGVIDNSTFPHHLLDKTIWVEFDGEWFQAKIIKFRRPYNNSKKNKDNDNSVASSSPTITLQYLVDKSLEKVKLNADFTGTNEKGKDRFKWKL